MNEKEIARLQEEVKDNEFKVFVYEKIVAELTFDCHCLRKENEELIRENEDFKSSLLDSINIVIEK